MDDLLAMINPAAGGGRADRVWRRLCEARPELAAVRRVEAFGADEAASWLDDALGDPAVRRLLVVGGDGTAHLAANRLLAKGRGEDVALGLVVAGTGSDLARCLRLPKRPEQALERLLAAPPRPIDALELRTDAGVREIVLNIASVGVSGAVDEVVNSIPNRGPLTYLAATLKALLTYDPLPCRVLVDGEELTRDPFFVVAVANGQYFGKGMRVAPDAELDDGLADVVLVPPVPLWQLPWRLPQFLSGRHVRLPIVQVKRGRIVRIEPPEGMALYDLDGETFPAAPCEIRVLPGALRILA